MLLTSLSPAFPRSLVFFFYALYRMIVRLSFPPLFHSRPELTLPSSQLALVAED
jgi:hypothetical protein